MPGQARRSIVNISASADLLCMCSISRVCGETKGDGYHPGDIQHSGRHLTIPLLYAKTHAIPKITMRRLRAPPLPRSTGRHNTVGAACRRQGVCPDGTPSRGVCADEGAHTGAPLPPCPYETNRRARVTLDIRPQSGTIVRKSNIPNDYDLD